MIAPTLSQVEELVGHLSCQEQLWLLERLAQRLRRALSPPPPAAQHQPALLSDDPAVQAELRASGDRLLREDVASQSPSALHDWQSDIALMVADPQIQAELRAIEQEFAVTEADGLERISPSGI